MAKILDYFSMSVVLILLTFVWSTLAFKSWVGALIFSVAITAIAVVTVRYILSKRNRPYSYERLALEFSIRGNEYVINLLKDVVKYGCAECEKNYIVLSDCVIISAFKFSMLTINDMGGICELAAKFKGKRIYVFARGIDRRAYSIVQLENVKFSLIKIKTVYKFLLRHNALPDLKPIKNKFSFRALLDAVLCRANFKSYAFSGAVLILVSFITPLKIYYIVFGSISLVLALLTLTPLGNGTLTSPKVISDLENAANANDNQISIDEIINTKNDENN
ncbi:MAG: hypothetical protein NC037_00830 [Bacteroides sp.]|nr:hypothetical protein [Bacillota bacterium]MCM1393437.1 hypothetical protein [[Eubacterium] siraeum]MCM1455063.1 hypothetical protein [Bacteroides sp.]